MMFIGNRYVGNAILSAVADINFYISTVTASAVGETEVTFQDNKRCGIYVSADDDVDLSIVANNMTDNYIWVINGGSADIDVTIAGITKDGIAVASSSIYLPDGAITVAAGKMCELGVIVSSHGAVITHRSDLDNEAVLTYSHD